MAYFRCGGGGVPASVKTDMNAVLNKKFGTSTDYPPADWAPTVNLMGPLPEKTQASASVCTFSDGADDVPTKSLVVTIPPTLSGVSSLTETQTRRNLLDFTAFSDYSNWKTDITENQSYPTGNANRGLLLDLPQGTYTITFGIDAETYPTYLYLCKDDGSASTRLIYFTGANFSVASGTFTVDGTSKYYFRLGSTGSEANFNGQIAKIAWGQIEIGSTAHAYEPYTAPTQYTADLGRTIYGGQADIVNGTGTDENGNDFTFDGQEINSRLGYNAFWSDSGDTEVTYRADIDLLLGGN